jgi:predicted nuclease of predicted toxin-antitoxin system
MSIKILIDMILSPDWVALLKQNGWPSVHWSTVGDPAAADRTMMDWEAANSYLVFTHDLHFGTALALTHATDPSVIQVRAQDVLPASIGAVVVSALRQHETDLASGALVVVELAKSRVRILPI